MDHLALHARRPEHFKIYLYQTHSQQRTEGCSVQAVVTASVSGQLMHGWGEMLTEEKKSWNWSDSVKVMKNELYGLLGTLHGQMGKIRDCLKKLLKRKCDWMKNSVMCKMQKVMYVHVSGEVCKGKED